jgi:hypothetical protein
MGPDRLVVIAIIALGASGEHVSGVRHHLADDEPRDDHRSIDDKRD